MGSILIVDDNDDLRFSLAQVVKNEGFSFESAATGAAAIEVLYSSVIDIVFLDINLPDRDGIDLIADLKEISHDISIVMLTGINEAKTAVEALKAGALDYIVKPFDIIQFKSVMHRLIQSRLIEKMVLLEEQELAGHRLVCACEQMRKVKTAVARAAQVSSTVMISGETGTGKEVVARAIHSSKHQQRGVFVKIDCGTLSANLIESELFGYDQGAFTDARKDKRGLVEVANGGTLFLDEIGNLPASLQPKLLRLIEESIFRKVGGLQDIKVSVRIIAATNSDLEQGVADNTFREDLYYRLNVIPIALPPLRDRENDILLLADFFLHLLNKEMKKNIKGFTDQATQNMLRYQWPGNIRELRNLIEREVIFSQTDWLALSELVEKDAAARASATAHLKSLKEIEQEHLSRVMQGTGNNKSQAARILGISRNTLRAKLAR